MMKTIHIEIVHDVVCSWCPIGYNHLKSALNKLKNEVSAEIRFLPYQLNPDLPEQGVDITRHMIQRMKCSKQQVTDYRINLLNISKKAGINIDFSKRTHYYNTLKAHRLIHWAESFGKQSALNNELIQAYFTRGEDINDVTTLLALCEKVGLSRLQAEYALNSDLVLHQLMQKINRVKSLNINSVPSFVFNHNQLITGSNSDDFFVTTLKKIVSNQTLSINKI